MTIQATITTLTLSVSFISGSWALANDEPTAGHVFGVVPLELEAQPLAFPGAAPLLPIETIGRQVAADLEKGPTLHRLKAVDSTCD